jgi:uncharacterized protein YcbK (DUF882 family)
MESDDECNCETCSALPVVTRRVLLGGLLGGVSLAAFSGETEASRRATRLPSIRTLSVINAATEEAWYGAYWRDGRLVPEAYVGLKRLFRDVRASRTGNIDVALFDAMWRIGQRLDTASPWRVFSAYRTDRTQNEIKRVNRSAAQRSFHTQGRAVDVALADRPAGAIAAVARSERIGGVGLYRRRGFVHLDTGPLRKWSR